MGAILLLAVNLKFMIHSCKRKGRKVNTKIQDTVLASLLHTLFIRDFHDRVSDTTVPEESNSYALDSFWPFMKRFSDSIVAAAFCGT